MGKAGKGWHLVGKKKDGGYAYEIDECPNSTLGRHAACIHLVMDWCSLGALPVSYSDLGSALWLRLRALKNVIEYVRNNTELDDDDRKRRQS